MAESVSGDTVLTRDGRRTAALDLYYSIGDELTREQNSAVGKKLAILDALEKWGQEDEILQRVEECEAELKLLREAQGGASAIEPVTWDSTQGET